MQSASVEFVNLSVEMPEHFFDYLAAEKIKPEDFALYFLANRSKSPVYRYAKVQVTQEDKSAN